MTLGQLAWRNMLRNPRRTTLTVLSIAFSLFLLSTLIQVVILLNGPETDDSYLRLVVRRSTSLADPLPASFKNKIRAIDGVRYVTPFTWFQGVRTENEQGFFGQFAVDAGVLLDLFQELILSREERDAFVREKSAAIVGRITADQMGWKLGDRVILTSQIWFNSDGSAATVELIIRGIFGTTVPGHDTTLFFHNDLFDEAMGRSGNVGTYWVKVRSLADSARVADTIDRTFRNTNAETKTETEKAFAASFMSMLGNVKLLFGSISAIVVLTILLVVSSTMAMSIRERSGEIAVMKTLGYRRNTILFLLIGEGIALSLTGGVVGLGLGWLFFSLVDLSKATGGMIPYFQLGGQVILIALIASLLIGVLSAAVPGIIASRQSVLAGLRQTN
ncbi:hypothetical protein CVU37_04065 [candidate division BRC1 bacterium HGW-BRC1-1]|jgi:putative ABC transport system permease protein|nr:MAG: hypothetical protein CVU37_04065 [candidate division BRC1 bacterium HGW-BRC1-1]